MLKLTPRQAQLLGLLSEGLTIIQAAAKISISVWTVRAYLVDARRDNNCKTLYQLIAKFNQEQRP